MDTLQFFEQTHQKANAADAHSAQIPPRKGGGLWDDAARAHRQARWNCPCCPRAIGAPPSTRPD
jgi:hypothetical protein